MIKDRNISGGAQIQLHKIMGGGGFGAPCGETFYSVKSGTNYAQWVSEHVDPDHWYGSTKGGCQYIIDNWCKDGAPNVILMGPGKIQENIIIIDREGLTIRSMVEGWFSQVRPSDATTKYSLSSVSGYTISGCGFLIMDRSVSIEGFLLDGGGNYCGMYIGDGYRVNTEYDENSASARVRNCVFRGGGEGQVGILLDGCGDDIRIEGNKFTQWEGAAIQIDPGGSRTVQRPTIRENEFVSQDAYGIDMYSAATTIGVLIHKNVFIDADQAVTYAIRCQGAGAHSITGNFFACTNKISAASTDFVSGNFTSAAGNAVNYVAVA